MSTDKQAQAKQRLGQSRQTLKKLLASLDEEQWQTVIISEGQTWTVADVVAHLLENEVGMSIHIHKIRQGRETVPEDFDLDQWNAGVKERAGQVDSAELLKKLDEARAKTLQALQSIEDDEWSLTGRHPLHGMITIEEYYTTIAGHDEDHIQDIKAGLGLT